MKKVKWGNVVKALVLVSCVGFIGYITFMLTVYSWITTNCVSLGYLGLALLIGSCVGISVICEDFQEQLKKIANGRNVELSNK